VKKLKKILDYLRWRGWEIEQLDVMSGPVFKCSAGEFVLNIMERDNSSLGMGITTDVLLPREADLRAENNALMDLIQALGVDVQHTRAPVALKWLEEAPKA